ncbi:MAG: winged helix-turn-helix transcriptional regulator [Mangrovibacterium sp.]
MITKTAVVTENANVPNGEGPILVDNFKPFPKNPTIAKFFMQLGRFDELGSGVLNINRYLKVYSGHDDPQFIEGYIFKTIIPLDEGLNEGLKTLLETVGSNPGIQAKELSVKLGRPLKTIERQVRDLVQKNLIECRGSKKTGGYFIISWQGTNHSGHY